MNIVPSTPDDVTLQEAARLAERSTKTLRRAVQDGHLVRRYVLGPRGPQLVFNQTELLTWLGGKAARRHTVSRGNTSGALTRQEYTSLVERVAQLHETLDEIGMAVAHLTTKVQEQDMAITTAQVALATLAGRISGLEGGSDATASVGLLDTLPSGLVQ